jgi:hypothetical protein
VAENQKQCDDWCSALELIILSGSQAATTKSSVRKPNGEYYSSSTSVSPPSSKRSSSYITANIAKQEDTSSSLNESADSNDSARDLGARDLDQFKAMSESNVKFVDTFDLDKCLNENEEDLRNGQTNESPNLFDFFTKSEVKIQEGGLVFC